MEMHFKILVWKSRGVIRRVFIGVNGGRSRAGHGSQRTACELILNLTYIPGLQTC